MSTPHDFTTKLEAAIAYLMTGSTEEAGRMVNVPGRTIRSWTQESWWEDVIKEAQTVKQKELDAIWTGLIHKAADKLRTTIDEGETVLTKTGETKKIPVKAKDLAIIMSIAVDKRALMRGQATSRKETVTIEKKLDMIADKFKEIGETKEPNVH